MLLQYAIILYQNGYKQVMEISVRLARM